MSRRVRWHVFHHNNPPPSYFWQIQNVNLLVNHSICVRVEATVAVAPIRQVAAPCTVKRTLQFGDGNASGKWNGCFCGLVLPSMHDFQHIQHVWCSGNLQALSSTGKPPFGDLQPGVHSDVEPAYLQNEGTLVLVNISPVCSCLLLLPPIACRRNRITLWRHQLHASQESSNCNQTSSHGAGRPRRVAGSLTEAGWSVRQRFAIDVTQ